MEKKDEGTDSITKVGLTLSVWPCRFTVPASMGLLVTDWAILEVACEQDQTSIKMLENNVRFTKHKLRQPDLSPLP